MSVPIIQVAVCVLVADGKIPLNRFKRNHLAGAWGIPGGKFDDAEFLPAAAEREMLEEIEQPVRFERHLATVDELVYEDGAPVTRCVLQICTVVPAGPIVHRRIDKEEGLFDWFTVDEIHGMAAEWVPSDYRIFQDIYLDGNGGYYNAILTKTGGIPRLDLFEKVA